MNVGDLFRSFFFSLLKGGKIILHWVILKRGGREKKEKKEKSIVHTFESSENSSSVLKI